MFSRRYTNRILSVLCVFYILLVIIINHLYAAINEVSDRYYSSIIIFLFPLFSFALLLLKPVLNTKVVWALCFVVTVFFSYDCFSSFRDNYINDIREILQVYAIKSEFAVIPQKEEIRTSDLSFSYKKIISTSKDVSEYDLFFSEYRYWGHDILIVRKEKKDSTVLSSIPDGTTIKAHTRVKTNKKGDSMSVSMYSPSKIGPIKQDFSISDKNLFKNSDLEIQQFETEVIKNLRVWGGDGATFYKSSFLLPQSIYLSTQRSFKTPFYPVAFSETDSPIEGKYSLHVKFNYDFFSDSDCYVGLFHIIESLPGAFSFYVKAVKQNSQLIITKPDIDSKGKWIAATRYYILLKDTQTHFLPLRFDSYVPSNRMFFILQGVSADVVLDCIQFIPD